METHRESKGSDRAELLIGISRSYQVDQKGKATRKLILLYRKATLTESCKAERESSPTITFTALKTREGLSEASWSTSYAPMLSLIWLSPKQHLFIPSPKLFLTYHHTVLFNNSRKGAF